jgi:hypothetical protein
MATRDDYLAQPLAARLARLARTPDDLASAMAGRSEADLARPGADDWSAKDVLCHLRDIEEFVMLRYHMMLAMDEPHVFVVGTPPLDPERWGTGGAVPFPLDPERRARERQYARNDASEALAAFRRRRGEVLAFLEALSPAQWQRAGIHPAHGRLTFEEWTAGAAGHDDNHLEQLRRALGGN